MYLLTLRDQIGELDDLVEELDELPPDHVWGVLDFAKASYTIQLVADISQLLEAIQKGVDEPYQEAQKRCREAWIQYVRRSSQAGWDMVPSRWEGSRTG